MVILNQGKIAADGTTETLRQGARGEYVINVSLSGADIESVKTELGSIEQVLAIEEALDRKAEDEAALHVRLSCTSASDLRADIYQKIKQTDWILLEFHQEVQSLENIFRQLTKES